MQRFCILNAIDLYSYIASKSQFFKRVVYLKQIIVITGGHPIAPVASPPFGPECTLSSSYPRILQKRNYPVTNNNAAMSTSFEQKLYKLIKNKNRLQLKFTRIIDMVTHGFERTSRLYLQFIANGRKKRRKVNNQMNFLSLRRKLVIPHILMSRTPMKCEHSWLGSSDIG